MKPLDMKPLDTQPLDTRQHHRGPRTARAPQPHRPAAALLAGLALLLAACGNLAPPHQRPGAPVAAQFPGTEGAAGAAGTAAAELPWQRFFDEPRLQRLIGLALANNRDLRLAVLNVEAARAQYGIRLADRWPTLNAGVSANRQPNGNGGIQSTYSAGLQISAWELDLFGRVKNLGESALARYMATDNVRKATQISLVAAVAQGDLALRADDELLELTRQTLATREDSLRLTQLKFDHGAVSELDLRQAQSLVAAARATLAQLERQRRLDENALVLLLGQPLPADLPARAPLDDRLLATELPPGLPSDLLERRPDIRSAEQQLIASRFDIGAARAAFFPRISLTGSVGSVSNELSGLLRGGSFGWSFAPQLLVPLFDAGRNQANLEAAQVQQRIAVAQYEQAVQVAFREVADALAGRGTLLEQSRAQQDQIDAESARLRLADLRYRNGVASYLDLLDAQRSLFGARQAGVQLRLARLQNQVDLYRVLGGGWLPADDAALSSVR